MARCFGTRTRTLLPQASTIHMAASHGPCHHPLPHLLPPSLLRTDAHALSLPAASPSQPASPLMPYTVFCPAGLRHRRAAIVFFSAARRPACTCLSCFAHSNTLLYHATGVVVTSQLGTLLLLWLLLQLLQQQAQLGGGSCPTKCAACLLPWLNTLLLLLLLLLVAGLVQVPGLP